jgi:hypothetical protein
MFKYPRGIPQIGGRDAFVNAANAITSEFSINTYYFNVVCAACSLSIYLSIYLSLSPSSSSLRAEGLCLLSKG